MIIIERVPCFLTFFSELHQTCAAQDAELMADGRLSHLKGVGDVADAHLLFHREKGEQLDAGRIP